MWYQEEIEGSVNNFSLLNEALINVCSLWRVGDCGIHAHLEESLSYTLVDNDQSMFWECWILVFVKAILHLDNLVELLKLVTDDLGSH